MVPVVALLGIRGIVRVAMFFLLAHEGPLFVKLNFPGLRGKKRATRRATAWHAHRQSDSNGSPYRDGPPRGGPSCERRNQRAMCSITQTSFCSGRVEPKKGVPVCSENRDLQLRHLSMRRFLWGPYRSQTVRFSAPRLPKSGQSEF